MLRERTQDRTSRDYGSGLRSGVADFDHTTPYASVNVGVSREFQLAPGDKPLTIRFDFVNLFDQIYELRDGAGIGVFGAALRR